MSRFSAQDDRHSTIRMSLPCGPVPHSRSDDCGLDNFDESCVDSAVAAGTYFILVNSFSGGETGAYNLDVACDEITACVECLDDSINCNEIQSFPFLFFQNPTLDK